MKKTLCVLVVLVLLQGCGGGGGGGGSGTVSNNGGQNPGSNGDTSGADVAAPMRLNNGGAFPFEPRLVINSVSRGLLVWSLGQLNPPMDINMISPQTGWQATPTQVAQDTGSTVKAFSLDDNGNSAFLWRDSDNDGIVAATIIDGVLSSPRLVGPTGVFPFAAPGPPTGPLAAAVWLDDNKIRSTFYVLGSGWASPEEVPLQTAQERNQGISRSSSLASLARIGVFDTGGSLVVWPAQDDIRFNTRMPRAPWSDAGIISPEPGNNRATLAVGPNRTAVYAWMTLDGSNESKVRATAFDGTSWTIPMTLDSHIASILLAFDVDIIQAAFDANGAATLMWLHSPTPDRTEDLVGVRVATWTDGQWGPVKAFKPQGGDADLAVNANGDKAVVWRSQDNQLVASRYDHVSRTWSGAIELLPVGRTVVDPQVGLKPDGSMVVVWAELDASFWTTTVDFP